MPPISNRHGGRLVHAGMRSIGAGWKRCDTADWEICGTMEAMLVLAAILQDFQVSCAPDYVVEPWPSITLQAKGGIWLRVDAAQAAD